MPLPNRVPDMPREQYVNDSAHHGLSINDAGTTLCVAGTMDDYAALVDRATGSTDLRHRDHRPLLRQAVLDDRGRRDTCWVSLSEADSVAVLDSTTKKEWPTSRRRPPAAHPPGCDHPGCGRRHRLTLTASAPTCAEAHTALGVTEMIGAALGFTDPPAGSMVMATWVPSAGMAMAAPLPGVLEQSRRGELRRRRSPTAVDLPALQVGQLIRVNGHPVQRRRRRDGDPPPLVVSTVAWCASGASKTRTTLAASVLPGTASSRLLEKTDAGCRDQDGGCCHKKSRKPGPHTARAPLSGVRNPRRKLRLLCPAALSTRPSGRPGGERLGRPIWAAASWSSRTSWRQAGHASRCFRERRPPRRSARRPRRHPESVCTSVLTRSLQAVAQPDQSVSDPRLDSRQRLVEQSRHLAVGVAVEVRQPDRLQLEIRERLQAVRTAPCSSALITASAGSSWLTSSGAAFVSCRFCDSPRRTASTARRWAMVITYVFALPQGARRSGPPCRHTSRKTSWVTSSARAGSRTTRRARP